MTSIAADEPPAASPPPAARTSARLRPMEHPVAAAIARGVQALAANDDSRLERSLLSNGSDAGSIESPFTAAIVIAALVRSGAASPSIESRRAALRESRDARGTWRFSADEPSLPPDADDTSCAAAALRLAGGTSFEARQSLEAILGYADHRGACRTWLGPNVRENEVDVVVNTNVLHLAAIDGIALPRVESHVLAFIDRWGLDCRRQSNYYRSPFLFAFFVSRWISAARGNAPGIRSSVAALCLRSHSAASRDPLSAACCVIAIATLSKPGNVPSVLIDAIVSTQGEGGLWPASTLFEGFGTYAYASSQVSTALCVEALSMAQVRSGMNWRSRAPACPRPDP